MGAEQDARAITTAMITNHHHSTTSPLSTSGYPAQLSATRRKLQRHGWKCRSQKLRRLTRGANPIFRSDAPPNRDWVGSLSLRELLAGAEQKKPRRVHQQKVGSAKPALVLGSCGRSLAHFLLDATKELRLVNHPFRLDSQRLLS